MTNYLSRLKVNKEKLNNAIISMGELSLLQKVFSKAQSGESITVAFIGGSITQGCLASDDKKCYAYLTYQWFTKQFPTSDIKYINAGIGATGSLIGIHRLERDILSFSPDVVFVEFSVNDKNCTQDKASYESLIRSLLSAKKCPAVIELFTGCENGSNVQEQNIAIGRNYQLPMLSYRDFIQDEINAGNITWKDISPDDTHPNDIGHSIISILIGNFLTNALTYKNTLPILKELPKPIFSNIYCGGKIVNSTVISPDKLGSFIPYNSGFQKFQYGWQSIKEQFSNKPMEITIKGKNIFILFKKSISEDFGKALITVNGKDYIEADGFFANGWGDYSETCLIASSNKETTYNLKIKKSSLNKEFIILGFLVSNQ